MMHGHGMMHGGALRRAGDLIDEVTFGKVYDHTVVTRLLRYLKDYKARFIIDLLSMIVYTLTMLAIPQLVGMAIDDLTTTKDLTRLTIWFGFFIMISSSLIFLAWTVGNVPNSAKQIESIIEVLPAPIEPMKQFVPSEKSIFVSR